MGRRRASGLGHDARGFRIEFDSLRSPYKHQLGGFRNSRAMFAVWKYGAEADQVQSIRQAADPAAFTRLQACNRCHSKKVSGIAIDLFNS